MVVAVYDTLYLTVVTCLNALCAPLQVDLIIKLLRKHLQDKGAHWVEVSTEAQHKLNQKLQERLKKTVWLQGGCKSWYLTTLSHNRHSGSDSGKEGGSAVEGEDKAGAPAGDQQQTDSSRSGGIVMWPGLCTEFWWRTLWPVDRDWRSGQAANPPAAGAELGAKLYKQHSP